MPCSTSSSRSLAGCAKSPGLARSGRSASLAAGPSRRSSARSCCSCTATGSAPRAVRIYKTYGTEAVQLISQNPYRLARDIRGIGFRTADQIAAKLGIEKTALIRVRAGIAYALTEAMDEGECGLSAAE